MAFTSWRTYRSVFTLAVALHVSAAESFSQICQINEVQKVASPADPITGGFAKTLGISGNTVIVGDESDSAIGSEAGAAYIYTVDGSTWLLTQTIHAEDSQPFQHFGTSVAIEGNVAVVGTRPLNQGADIHHGAAYVFTLVNGSWLQTAKLADESINDPPEFPREQNMQRRFGIAVAIDGNSIIVGAPQDCTQAFNAGAAYIYRFEEDLWLLQQKLLASSAAAFDQLGYGVGLNGSRSIVAAPGAATGQAYTFDFDGRSWSQSGAIPLPGGSWPSEIVAPVAVRGDFVVLGSPLAVINGYWSGAAFVFRREFGFWSPVAELTSDKPEHNDRFGASVAFDGDYLAVGAPQQTVQYPLNSPDVVQAGKSYLFQAKGEQWTLVQTMAAELEISAGGPGVMNRYSQMGTSISIDATHVVAGAPTPTNVNDSGPISALYVFDVHPPDCDENGVPDECDIDCNHNLVTDACDLAAGIVRDCDGNAVPDECDAPLGYYITETDWVLGHGGFNEDIDFVWLNQFTVTSGHQIITHILIPWTAWIPDGHPAKLVLYDDPNNDGDPHDAMLLTTLDVNGFNDNGLQVPVSYSAYAIVPTFVGNVGDSFFVGAFSQAPNHISPATGYSTMPALQTGQSWYAKSPIGKGSFVDLTANEVLSQPASVNYALRALALDCNGNGAWDQCDIDSGFSQDTNKDGVPDECQPFCAIADATGNGVIDVDDLLAVINNWGACDPPPGKCSGDVTGNGVVDVDDLLMVVNNWGPCV